MRPIEGPRRLVLAYGLDVPVARGIPPGSTKVEITLVEMSNTWSGTASTATTRERAWTSAVDATAPGYGVPDQLS